MNNLFDPDVRARRELHGWETDTEINFDEVDKELLVLFFSRVFASEDSDHLKSDSENEEPLFKESELQKIREIADKYPVFSLAILDFFSRFLEPEEAE